MSPALLNNSLCSFAGSIFHCVISAAPRRRRTCPPPQGSFDVSRLAECYKWRFFLGAIHHYRQGPRTENLPSSSRNFCLSVEPTDVFAKPPYSTALARHCLAVNSRAIPKADSSEYCGTCISTLVETYGAALGA
jgi:hypothetical protein